MNFKLQKLSLQSHFSGKIEGGRLLPRPQGLGDNFFRPISTLEGGGLLFHQSVTTLFLPEVAQNMNLSPRYWACIDIFNSE